MAGTAFISIKMTPAGRDIAGQFARITMDLLAVIESTMADVGAEALQIAQNYAPRNTGTFVRSLSLEPYTSFGSFGSGFAILTSEPNILAYLEGTGIYGPSGMDITAKSEGPLVFSRPWLGAGSPNHGGSWVFMSVAGQQQNPWKDEAQKDIMDELGPRLSTIMTQVDWQMY